MQTKDTIWLPVRCCCQPQKIFGFMAVPAEATNRPFMRLPYDYRETTNELVMQQVDIEFREFTDRGKTQLAIYSDDRPLSFWKQIPEFIPTPEGGR